jgi:hypothetical protein
MTFSRSAIPSLGREKHSTDGLRHNTNEGIFPYTKQAHYAFDTWVVFHTTDVCVYVTLRHNMNECILSYTKQAQMLGEKCKEMREELKVSRNEIDRLNAIVSDMVSRAEINAARKVLNLS